MIVMINSLCIKRTIFLFCNNIITSKSITYSIICCRIIRGDYVLSLRKNSHEIADIENAEIIFPLTKTVRISNDPTHQLH